MIVHNFKLIDVPSRLSYIRNQNTRIHQQRIEQIYNEIPEIKEIDIAIADIGISEAKRRILGETKKTEEYNDIIKELSQEKKDRLKEKGYPEDYLEPIYDCPDCKDWGDINGEVCKCVKNIKIKEFYKRSKLENILKNENFDNFNLDYYSRDDFKNRQMTPYENALNIINDAKRYVKEFDQKHESILIYGTGVIGKTFLVNCIAKALLDTEHTVLYLKSKEMFKEVLGTDIKTLNIADQEALKILNSYIFECELLIIDELGSEPLNLAVRPHFFEIINKRLLKNRATIITTSYDMDTLGDRYTERIRSRIEGDYILYNLYGKDFRLLKRKIQ